MTLLEAIIREDIKIIEDNNSELNRLIMRKSGAGDHPFLGSWERKVNSNLEKITLIKKYLVIIGNE